MLPTAQLLRNEALPWLIGLALIVLGAATLEGLVRTFVLRLPYDWRAFAASLGDSVGRRVVDMLGLSVAAPILAVAYAHRLTTLELSTAAAFAVLFIGQEFFYYCYHRAAHRVRWFWATHSVHHSSNELTLAAALRLGWTGKATGTAVFFVPLVWLGFPPLAVGAAFATNLLYQFWLHAPWMPRLGPLEWVLNTPTHHKVHHASNGEYLDCNYGGVLIVFDRLFGTFRDLRDDVPLRYGLTTPLTSHNPIRIALHGWLTLGRDLRQARGPLDALAIVFGPPDRVRRPMPSTPSTQTSTHAVRGAMLSVLLVGVGIAVCAWSAAALAASGDDPVLLEGAAMPSASSGAASLPAGVRKLADLSYGASARQRVDVYLPPPGTVKASGAPILVMVHGGAWMFGDKSSRGVVGAKIDHWVAHGWILVSVNNRLLPEAAPLLQADDVAAAVAFVQRQAPAWGGDARKLILMGHSAGAHLVALVDAAPDLAARAGAAPWAGTVALDSAALDLPTLMARRHARFYDHVFGADPQGWKAVSPVDRLGSGAPPMLLVCSSTRGDDSCGQSDRFASRAASAGVAASVHREALSHAQINADLGKPGSYTDAVDAFIASVTTH